jgi:cobalamin biosynthesis protein CobT
MNWWARQTTVSDFQDEMAGTTAVLGRDKSVEVTFSGNKAYVKDGVVNFPNLDPTMTLDYSALSLFRGWVDHESAKVRFSDRAFMKTKDELIEKNPLLHDLFSSIEGVRVERDYIDLYSGSAKNLSEMSTATTKQVVKMHRAALRAKKDPTGVEDAMPGMKSKNQLCKEWFDIDINEIKENAEDGHERSQEVLEEIDKLYDAQKDLVQAYENPQCILPQALGAFGREDFPGVYNWEARRVAESFIDKKQMEKWVEAMKKLESTEDSFELAKQIIEEIKHPNQETGEGDGDGDGDEDGEGGGEGEGQGEGEAGEGKVGSVPINEGAHSPVDMTDVLESGAMGSYTYEAGEKNKPYRVYSTDEDTNFHWSDGKWREDVKAYMFAKEHIDSEVATMKRKIELLIQATRKIDWDVMKEEGKFDSKRMVGAYNAEPNVYKTREDASDLDTCVGILIDMSGSMNDYIVKNGHSVPYHRLYDDGTTWEDVKRKSDVALETSILLSECMDKIGVPFSITGFDSGPCCLCSLCCS